MLTAPTGNNTQTAVELTPTCFFRLTAGNRQNHGRLSNRYVKHAQYLKHVSLTLCHSPKRRYRAFGLTRPKATGAECAILPHQLVIVETDPTNERPDMNQQLAEMTAAITKAEIAMKAAAWQLETQSADIAMLRKALFELAYVAEENGIYLSNLTKSTQDTIVAMRLGGFK